MPEFDHIYAAASNPADLTAKLNAKAAQGWDVVSVYTWDGSAIAIIKRNAQVNTPAQYTSSTPTAVAQAVSAQPAATPSVNAPANWYPDPSGRYELRYWNGEKWTEHVSTGGQQSTDAPVK